MSEEIVVNGVVETPPPSIIENESENSRIYEETDILSTVEISTPDSTMIRDAGDTSNSDLNLDEILSEEKEQFDKEREENLKAYNEKEYLEEQQRIQDAINVREEERKNNIKIIEDIIKEVVKKDESLNEYFSETKVLKISKDNGHYDEYNKFICNNIRTND